MEETKKNIRRQDKMLGWFLCILGPLMTVTALVMKFNGDGPLSTLSCVLLVAISSTMFVAGLLCLTRPSLFAMILGGLSFFAWSITAATAVDGLDELGREFASIVTPASLVRLLFGSIIGVIIGKLILRFRNQPKSPADAAAESTDPSPPENPQ
jgi:hypothetical protein